MFYDILGDDSRNMSNVVEFLHSRGVGTPILFFESLDGVFYWQVRCFMIHYAIHRLPYSKLLTHYSVSLSFIICTLLDREILFQTCLVLYNFISDLVNVGLT
jgi:hypothetical protein